MFSVHMREVSDGIQVEELWDVVPLGEKCLRKLKVHRGTEKNTTGRKWKPLAPIAIAPINQHIC